jgi:heat shock protein HslJ
MDATKTRTVRTLLSPGALAAAFVAFASAAPAPTPTQGPPRVALENTHWSLVALGGSPAGTDPLEAFILFRPGEGGRLLGGTGGCNGLKGTYDTFAGRLRVSPTVLSGRACPAAAAARETKLVEALRATANYRIAGTRLELLGTDGRVLARFAAH